MKASAATDSKPWRIRREDSIVAIVIAATLVVVLLFFATTFVPPPTPSPIQAIPSLELGIGVASLFIMNLQWPVGLELGETFHAYGNISNHGPLSASLQNLTVTSPFTLESWLPTLPAAIAVNSTLAYEMTIQAPSTPGLYNVTITGYLGP